MFRHNKKISEENFELLKTAYHSGFRCLNHLKGFNNRTGNAKTNELATELENLLTEMNKIIHDYIKNNTIEKEKVEEQRKEAYLPPFPPE